MSSGRPAAVDVAMTAIPLETGSRRDEWLVADGASQGDGSRRSMSFTLGRRVCRSNVSGFDGVVWRQTGHSAPPTDAGLDPVGDPWGTP